MRNYIPLVILLSVYQGTLFSMKRCSYYQNKFLEKKALLKDKKKKATRGYVAKYLKNHKAMYMQEAERMERERLKELCCGGISAKDIGRGLAAAIGIGIPVIIAIVQIIIPLII